MFGELPKLLDRNFAIGFYLPAALLLSLFALVLSAFGLFHIGTELAEVSALAGTTIAIATVWLAAIGLLAINYTMLRVLEGYGDWHPLQWRKERMRKLFDRQVEPALSLQAEIDAARDEGRAEPAMPQDHPMKLRNAVEAFPDKREWVLPTRFGNMFRAIEVYPRVLYGIDAIPAWPRLQAVLPKEFREQLAGARAQLDFCENLVFAGVASLLLFAGLALHSWRFPSVLPLLAGLALAVAGYFMSFSALAQFGQFVRSAFDLYRADLAKQLGLALPRSLVAEREMWHAVSRMMIFRSLARANQLVQHRPVAAADTGKGKTASSAAADKSAES